MGNIGSRTKGGKLKRRLKKQSSKRRTPNIEPLRRIAEQRSAEQKETEEREQRSEVRRQRSHVRHQIGKAKSKRPIGKDVRSQRSDVRGKAKSRRSTSNIEPLRRIWVSRLLMKGTVPAKL